MRYIKYLLLTIFILPISVFAYELKCDDFKVYEYGDEFSCTLKGQANIEYESIAGNIELSSGSVLSCEKEVLQNGFEIKEEVEGLEFSFRGTNTTEDLIKFNCKVATKPATSKLEQLVIPELKYDIANDNRNEQTEVIRSNSLRFQEYLEVPTGDVKPRDTTNANSRLKEIRDQNLEFVFSSFKTIYDLEVKYEVSELNLSIIPNNENATVEIQGSQRLEVGMNVIDIVVTSPDLTAKTCYTLNVKRLKRGEDIYYPTKDSSLVSLSIDNYPINFESVILEYNIHLTYDVDSVKVNATAKESGSIIEISNTSNLHNESSIEVTVTSEDGSNKTVYIIKVKKDAPPKDYRNLIYGGAIVGALVLVIIIIIITNTRNKNNPLLGRKKEKKEEVPPVQPVVQEQSAPVEPVAPQPVQQPEVQVPTTPEPVQPVEVQVPMKPQPVEPNDINVNQ